MWHWLLTLNLLTLSPFAQAARDFSIADAQVLWQTGSSLFLNHQYAEAIDPLQKVVKKYPGHPGYLEAHYFLGQALLFTGKPEKSLEPLRYFIQATPNVSSGVEARIWLGRALMDLKKFDSAYLTAVEIEKAVDRTLKQPDQSVRTATPQEAVLQARGFLLRAQTQIALKQPKPAARSLDSARQFISSTQTPAISPLEAEARFVELNLKTYECQTYLHTPIKSEAHLKSQAEQRGLCLLEAADLYNRVQQAQDAAWTEKATRHLETTFQSYADRCYMESGSRQNRIEANEFLRQNCRMKYLKAVDILNATPASNPLINRLKVLAENR